MVGDISRAVHYAALSSVPWVPSAGTGGTQWCPVLVLVVLVVPSVACILPPVHLSAVINDSAATIRPGLSDITR